MKQGTFRPPDQRQLKLEFEQEQKNKQKKRPPPDIIFLHTQRARRGDNYICKFKKDIEDADQQVINDNFKLIFKEDLDSREIRIQR